MTKPFITYTTQIEKLKNEKNLIITNTDFTLTSLKNISYYGLIDGYKHPFIDIHTRKYVNNTCFKIQLLFTNQMKNYVDYSSSIYAVQKENYVLLFLTTSVKNMENVKKNTLIPTTTI